MLSRYKEWVKRHPGVVQNLDWLLLFTVWNPSRTSGGSEATYEAYHAAIGLVSLWHQSILEEEDLATSRPAPYLWLDAIEYVETLIELRGMHLESQGKMSRYAPLVVVETVKALLKMAAWSRHMGHMFLRRPSPDDLHQFESEMGLQDILASLERLRLRYTAVPEVVSEPPPPPQASAGRAAGTGGSGSGMNHSCGPSSVQATAVEPSSCGAAGGGAINAVQLTAAGTVNGCAGCGPVPAADGCAGEACRATYGVREYLGEWVGGLVPQRQSARRRPAGADAGAGCGDQSREASSSPPDPCCCSTSDRGCEPDTADRMGRGQRTDPGVWAWPSWRQPGGAGGAVSCHVVTHQTAGGARPPAGSQLSSPPLAKRASSSGRARAGTGAGGGVGGPGHDLELHMGRNLVWLAELLHIWRPLVYVTLLKRYNRRSWRPWLVSLSVDLLSGHFHHRGRQYIEAAEARAAAAKVAAAAGPFDGAQELTVEGEATTQKTAVPPPPRTRAVPGAGASLLSLALARSLAAPGTTAGEERELYDRRRKLALYLLRSPFLEATTLSWLSALRNATRRMPLVGFGADYLYGLVETFTAYYSYTSGSN